MKNNAGMYSYNINGLEWCVEKLHGKQLCGLRLKRGEWSLVERPIEGLKICTHCLSIRAQLDKLHTSQEQ